ncbi:GntR family transcriptional regulator [Streptomyces microflavus]|uniref:GntR family transcriptional regulator n=1 Tax=Streptomyces microflavus TaxID=1919 RepID=UPI002E3288BA|nr:GntR family transcriptional regulator [Streptomyces microflavus]
MTKIGYAEIAAELRKQMQNGQLNPGDRIPSLNAIQEQYGVTVTTANRAFKQLKAEGLTYAKPGVGTVVAARPRSAATGAARIDRLNATGKPFVPEETATDHMAVIRGCNDDDIIEQLRIEPFEEVVIRRRTFRRNDVPYALGLSFIHQRALRDVPEIAQAGPLHPFWQKTYTERTGKEITRSPERRTARLAAAYELEALEVPAPAHAAVPVLVLHTTFYDEDGPIELWEDVYTPGFWQESTG